MPVAISTHGLPETAARLSVELERRLRGLASKLAPSSADLERHTRRIVTEAGFTPPQRRELAAMAPHAVAAVLRQGAPAAAEHVEYHARRLAKLNAAHPLVLQTVALCHHAAVTARVFDAATLWALEQLHLATILAINAGFHQVREREAQAWMDLARVELEATGLQDLLTRSAEVLRVAHRADWAEARLLTPAERRRLAKPLCRTGPGGTLWSVPLRAPTGVWGAIQLGFGREYPWLPRERELLEAAAHGCQRGAERLGLLRDLAERETRIRTLAAQLNQAEERERSRLSRELHDEAGQSLLCVRLQLELLERTAPVRDETWFPKLGETRGQVERTIDEIRRLIAALSPAVLERFGLAAGIRQLGQRLEQQTGARVTLRLEGARPVPESAAIMIYRMVQECCQNISKHSAATKVRISLTSTDSEIRVEVADNGRGFHPDQASRQADSFGLIGLRQRVELLGGRLSIASGRGTAVKIRLPLPEPPEGKVEHGKDPNPVG